MLKSSNSSLISVQSKVLNESNRGSRLVRGSWDREAYPARATERGSSPTAGVFESRDCFSGFWYNKNMNKEINDYIKKQKSPQKEICQKLRKIIIKTFPSIKEKMWVGVPWYEGRYYIGALKDHVNLGFAIKGLPKKELNLFEGKGKTMRHIKIYSLEDVDEKKIIKLLKVAKKVRCSCYPLNRF